MANKLYAYIYDIYLTNIYDVCIYRLFIVTRFTVFLVKYSSVIQKMLYTQSVAKVQTLCELVMFQKRYKYTL